jgi:hypothetical protein
MSVAVAAAVVLTLQNRPVIVPAPVTFNGPFTTELGGGVDPIQLKNASWPTTAPATERLRARQLFALMEKLMAPVTSVPAMSASVTEPLAILAPVTELDPSFEELIAPVATLGVVTALRLSCLAPTECAGNAPAA